MCLWSSRIHSFIKDHASQNLNAQIILPLANQSQLNTLLQDLYDPKSPNFHHFLTPAQFAQQFSASQLIQPLFKNSLIKKGFL